MVNNIYFRDYNQKESDHYVNQFWLFLIEFTVSIAKD